MTEQDEYKDYTPIPGNRSGTGFIKSLPIRNLIEGAIESFLVDYPIIVLIPFTWRVRIILVLALTICIMFANIIGIQQRSYTQAFIDWVRDKNQHCTLQLGSVADENSGITTSTDSEYKSYYKRAALYVKSEVEAENSGFEPTNQAVLAKIIRFFAKAANNFKANTGM